MCRICATALAFLKCGGVALLFVAGVRVMVALGIRPGGGLSLPFWLSAVWAALMPAPIGHQDLAAYIARQPGVSERWRDHLIASPFGTIHAATFSFSRPIGTAMPEPEGVQPVNFDPRSLDGNTWSLDVNTGAEMDACAEKTVKSGHQIWCAGYDESFNGYIYTTTVQ